MRVTFPDGTSVTGSRLPVSMDSHPTSDFGLYMDPAWKPSWPHEFIDWPDYEVPSLPESAATMILGAFERAKTGDLVEVGCHGALVSGQIRRRTS